MFANHVRYEELVTFYDVTRWGGNDPASFLNSKLNAAGGALVRSAFDLARGNGWTWGDNYDTILQEQRDNQAAYNEENPIRTGLGRAGGIALGVARGPAWAGPARAPAWARGTIGAIGTGAGYGFVGGALEDASSIQ